MKNILSIIFQIAFFSFAALAQPGPGKYILYIPQGITTETVQDFKHLLELSTSKKWQTLANDKNTGQGILLKLSPSANFKTKESFSLQSNGTDFLTITSSSVEGLEFGFYKHLRQLGFQFFLPDENYTVIPKLINPFGPKKNLVDQPFLQIRNFFGTGGFGTGNSDTDKLVEKAWNLWKLRNGFNAAYSLGGHRGENFILENQEVLKKNPQWLASPLTGQYSDVGIKLNYQNKDALNFYTDWTIKPFTQPGFVLPPANYTELISIEPSDGGGYLNEYQTNNSLPSISDQVYNAANVAAQKLDKLFPKHPNIGVNLYAYSSHAAPPSFPLHPRVFVQLVPYQFQNIAYGPSFIKLWSSKVKRFGIYDFYNYPDAQFDLPGGLSIDEAMKRLMHSVRNGSEGTHYETSFSKFATGIPLWLLCRYMADGDANWKKNLEALTNSLYASASKKISELFHLFYNEPSFGPQYLGNAAMLVREASLLSKDVVVQNRLNELKQYLQFVHLVYNSRDINKGSLHQRLLPVAEYAWKLYPQKLVHSYRIIQLISYTFLNIDKSDKEYSYYQKLHVDWFLETERNKTAWNKIKQEVNVSQIEKDFGLLQKTYNSVSPIVRYMFKEIKPLIKSGFVPNKTVVIAGDDGVRGYFGVYTDKPATLNIRYKVNGLKPVLTFSSIDQDYIKDTAIVTNMSSGIVTIKLAEGETTVFMNTGQRCTYRIQANLSNGLYFFDSSPRGKMAFYKNFSDPYESHTYAPSYYPSYVYVPKHLTSIDYKVQLNALTITSPSGSKINSDILFTEHGGFETRRFRIAPQDAGKIWKAEVSGNFNYSFLNVTDRYLLIEPK